MFLRIYSTLLLHIGQVQSQEIHTESGMIYFFSSYLFIYYPSCFEVDFSSYRFFFDVRWSQLSFIVDLSRPDDIQSRSRVTLRINSRQTRILLCCENSFAISVFFCFFFVFTDSHGSVVAQQTGRTSIPARPLLHSIFRQLVYFTSLCFHQAV